MSDISIVMPLIVLTDNLIVRADQIKYARRDGNYTDICFTDDLLPVQLWDEDRVIWKRIELAATPYWLVRA